MARVKCKHCGRTFNVDGCRKVFCSKRCADRHRKSTYAKAPFGLRGHTGELACELTHNQFAELREEAGKHGFVTGGHPDIPDDSVIRIRDEGLYPGFCLSVDRGEVFRYGQILLARERAHKNHFLPFGAEDEDRSWLDAEPERKN